MPGRTVFWLLLGLWGLCVVLSVAVPASTEPTDIGFTRGLNRVSLFFKFQIAAVVLAVPLWVLARQQQSRALRWLGRTPAILALAGVVAVLGLLLWATLSHPAPDLPPPQATTAPVTDG